MRINIDFFFTTSGKFNYQELIKLTQAKKKIKLKICNATNELSNYFYQNNLDYHLITRNRRDKMLLKNKKTSMIRSFIKL